MPDRPDYPALIAGHTVVIEMINSGDAGLPVLGHLLRVAQRTVGAAGMAFVEYGPTGGRIIAAIRQRRVGAGPAGADRRAGHRAAAYRRPGAGHAGRRALLGTRPPARRPGPAPDGGRPGRDRRPDDRQPARALPGRRRRLRPGTPHRARPTSPPASRTCTATRPACPCTGTGRWSPRSPTGWRSPTGTASSGSGTRRPSRSSGGPRPRCSTSRCRSRCRRPDRCSTTGCPTGAGSRSPRVSCPARVTSRVVTFRDVTDQFRQRPRHRPLRRGHQPRTPYAGHRHQGVRRHPHRPLGLAVRAGPAPGGPGDRAAGRRTRPPGRPAALGGQRRRSGRRRAARTLRSGRGAARRGAPTCPRTCAAGWSSRSRWTCPRRSATGPVWPPC